MYQIMVVEDEDWIRNAVIKMVEQMEGDYEVVAEAGNGIEALHLIDTTWPMIVITDIMMPLQDGLWLVKEIYERQLPIISIIVTGYSEFEYAKQALRYNVSDYLLKPVLEEELAIALKEARARIPQYENQRVFFLNIQHFFDKLTSLNPKSIFQEQRQIVQSIVQANSLTESEKAIILKTFSSKYNDHIQSIYSSFNRIPLNDYNSNELEAHFFKLTECWLKHYNALFRIEMRQVIRDACEYIQANLSEDLSVADITQKLHISISQFSMLFKKYTGQSFVSYLNHHRIQQAKHLLINNEHKVYEIAEMVGFNSLPHFNRVFKQITGVSPNDYKKGISV